MKRTILLMVVVAGALAFGACTSDSKQSSPPVTRGTTVSPDGPITISCVQASGLKADGTYEYAKPLTAVSCGDAHNAEKVVQSQVADPGDTKAACARLIAGLGAKTTVADLTHEFTASGPAGQLTCVVYFDGAKSLSGQQLKG